MSEYSRLFDGWLTRYKLNRPLNKYELTSRLKIKNPIDLPPLDKGIIKLNSQFIEYVDRYFFWRGWAAMGCVLIATTWLYFAFLSGASIYAPFNNGRLPSDALIIEGWIVTILFVSFFIATCVFAMKKDFLCYTHYPIRFNRTTRKVYVFQHNGPAGVLEVDWEKVYWIIGKIKDTPDMTYDLRGHILDDGGIIRHSFSVGHCSKNWVETLQHWEMIRRYMEESPAVLPFPPLHLFFCTEPTLRNAFISQVTAAEGLKSLPLFIFGSIWAFFRWISQKTCRKPCWPASVEATCQIADDDPYRQPEPWRIGEILGMTEEDQQKSHEYTLQANAVAAEYKRAHPEPSDL